MIDKESYIKGKGLSCPFCETELVEGRFIQIEAGKAFQEMCCIECEGVWQDVYELIDIIPYQRQ
jgi:Zn-finger nucleic acid-binding protein